MDETLSTSKRSFGKFFLAFLGMLIGVFILYIIVFWSVQSYNQKQGEKKVIEFEQQIEQIRQEIQARQMRDTYGGKTPQETLRMYIDAAEKGDYELASKYFAEGKREEELVKLRNSPKENTLKVLELLKADLSVKGSFSTKKDTYVVSKPLLLHERLYPNGIWKIVEI